jgi:transposase
VQIDSLEQSIARFDAAIEEACHPFAEAVAHLDTISGVARATAEVIVSEIGTDMSRFPTSAHLASWAGVCPGNRERAGKRRCGRTRREAPLRANAPGSAAAGERAGKRRCGRTRPGNHALRSALVQAAWAAGRKRDTYLWAQFQRLAVRRGRKRALLAVAHSILVIVYRLLERGEDYKDLGADYFDQRSKGATTLRLVNRLQQLGYEVVLNPQTEVQQAA